MEIRNKTGPRTLTGGTPAFTRRGEERVPLRGTHWLREWRKSGIQEWSWPWIPSADSLGNKARCHAVSKTREMYVHRDGPDLMSEMKGLHLLLGESKQHVQGRVTWSESELVI